MGLSRKKLTQKNTLAYFGPTISDKENKRVLNIDTRSEAAAATAATTATAATAAEAVELLHRGDIVGRGPNIIKLFTSVIYEYSQ
jgi:hypothetical protein